MVLFTRRLASSVGFQGPAMMYIYYIMSGFFLRRLLPNFARMTSKQQQLEGDFRTNHTRLLMHAEEIAFYLVFLPPLHRGNTTLSKTDPRFSSLLAKEIATEKSSQSP